jgi:hypothetical protein
MSLVSEINELCKELKPKQRQLFQKLNKMIDFVVANRVENNVWDAMEQYNNETDCELSDEMDLNIELCKFMNNGYDVLYGEDYNPYCSGNSLYKFIKYIFRAIPLSSAPKLSNCIKNPDVMKAEELGEYLVEVADRHFVNLFK